MQSALGPLYSTASGQPNNAFGHFLGQLGVQRLSRRFKQDIAPIGAASAALLKLRLVALRYAQADERGQHPM